MSEIEAAQRIDECVEITRETNKEENGPESPKYKRLTLGQEAQILRLAAEDVPQVAIAEAVGCSQPTVSRVLAEFGSTIHAARKFLEANALEAAREWKASLAPAAEKGDHKPAKELLQAIGVVQKDAAATQTAVQVNVGMPGSPALADPFASEDA